ncbi:PASTA domain-containing protein [Deinococcus humi]|uniref:PASTA domain-containing protein n=1 Tax=Deinococcus humi TaxID=662880 RepID=A0A7W8NEM4_9DEIO|nr:PASTA domain-containing protein [Deinococcus humi]MBB5363496.1 hypothetical protein [Deinococcus humi]GGO30509.1 hypothetical protein GCM10008949_25460 [Deinococcus humi]
MTNPSGAGGGFGRTLQELFTVNPVQGQGPAPTLAGEALIEVPDLTGMEQAEAEQLLRERRLSSRIRPLTADGDPGTVKHQAPKAGEVATAGTQVTLYVIKARELSDLEKIRKVFDDAKVLTADNFVQAMDDNEDFQKYVATVKVAYDALLKKIEGLVTQQDANNALQNLTTKADLQSATGALEREDVASRRFEELKRLIQANSGGDGPNPTSSKAKT